MTRRDPSGIRIARRERMGIAASTGLQTGPRGNDGAIAPIPHVVPEPGTSRRRRGPNGPGGSQVRGRGRRLWWLVLVIALAADVAVAATQGADTIKGSGAAALQLTATSLVFTPTHPVSIPVASPAAVTWSITDIRDQTVASGTERPDGKGMVITPKSDLDEGFYKLKVASSGQNTINAQFMVIGNPPTDNPYFGVATHHRDPANSIPLMASMGLDMSRAETGWASFEKTAGVIQTPSQISDWIHGADQTGAASIWMMGYGNPLYQNGQEPPTSTDAVDAFTKYVTTFLDQNPSVRNIEVYNEFNRGTFNTSGCRTGTCYASLLKAVYTAVKADHPDVQVIGGAYGGYSASWFTELFEAGGYQYADAWSYHPYAMSPAKMVSTVDSINGLQKQYGDGGALKPVYFTEIGWSSVESQADLSGLRVDSEAEQAYRMVADYVAPMSEPNVKGVAWYDLLNDTKKAEDGTQSNFGLFLSPTDQVTTYQPKESAFAFYYMREQLDGYTYDSSDQTDGALDYTFKNDDGKTLHVLFRSDLSQLANTSGATSSVKVTDLTGSPAVTTVMGQQSAVASKAGGAVTVAVGDTPLFVRSS